jgi:hypothetical protein
LPAGEGQLVVIGVHVLGADRHSIPLPQ